LKSASDTVGSLLTNATIVQISWSDTPIEPKLGMSISRHQPEALHVDVADEAARKLRWPSVRIPSAPGLRPRRRLSGRARPSGFNPKAAPPKTPAFWAIVDANRAPEDAELADALDALGVNDEGVDLGRSDAVTLTQLVAKAERETHEWLLDRKNRRAIPYRLEQCGYVPVRNTSAEDGLFKVKGCRQVVYAKASLSIGDRLKAVDNMIERQASSR
jgi:hypothetical protein